MFRNGDDGFGGYEGGGGGFDVSGFGGETPQGDKKAFKRTERIVPVTVRQILDSPDTGIKIGSIDVEGQMIKLIGIIKKINRSSVKVIYTLEDNTGAIEGVQWLEADAEDNFVVPVVENTYCTMVGSIRNTSAQHTQRHIMVFQIFPVTDLNEVTAHTLQILHITLKSEDLNQTPSISSVNTTAASSTFGGAMESFNGVDHHPAANFGLNPIQQKVLRIVMEGSNDTVHGIHIDSILAAMKIPLRELEKVLVFLSNEGHIYSTADEHYYKATDNM